MGLVLSSSGGLAVNRKQKTCLVQGLAWTSGEWLMAAMPVDCKSEGLDVMVLDCAGNRAAAP